MASYGVLRAYPGCAMGASPVPSSATPSGTPFATSGEDFLANVIAYDDNFTPAADHRELILIAVLVAKVDGVA